MFKLLKYALYDILKSRFAIIYTVFLALVAISIYQVSDDLSKVSLSLMNIMILFIPLIAAVFATTHFYNNLEFIELMLAQPVKRIHVFLSQLLAVVIMLLASVVVILLRSLGVIIPIRTPGHIEMAYLAGVYWLTK